MHNEDSIELTELTLEDSGNVAVAISKLIDSFEQWDCLDGEDDARIERKVSALLERHDVVFRNVNSLTANEMIFKGN